MPKGGKITMSKRYLYLLIHCSIFRNSQVVEITWVTIDAWMDKENMGNIYKRILFQKQNRRRFFNLWEYGWGLRALCPVKYVRQNKTNTLRYHFYVLIKKKKFGSRIDWCLLGWEKNRGKEWSWLKGTSGDVTYRMVTMLNNTVLYI